MNSENRAYIGMGSNLGDRMLALQTALNQLASAAGLKVLAVSEVFECPAWGYESSNDYLNLVVECTWDGPPLHLQELCYKIETGGGRHRAGANPPRYYQDRTIDLDLLFIEGINTEDERLTLPHPRAHLRGFVLKPLSELAPALQFKGKSVVEWLTSVPADELAAIQPVGRLEQP